MSRYDADDTYCYPGTDVLRNKAEITNAEDLDAYEGELSTLRSIEILENPIAGQFDLAHLQAKNTRRRIQALFPPMTANAPKVPHTEALATDFGAF